MSNIPLNSKLPQESLVQIPQLPKGVLTPRQQRYMPSIPPFYRKAVEQSFLKKVSALKAIKAKCITCSNFQREEITCCTVQACPLWEYRPYQVKPPKPPKDPNAPKGVFGNPFKKKEIQHG